MPTPQHPSAEELVAFTQGRLDEDAARRVEEHLATCDHCCANLEELTARTDRFLDLLRSLPFPIRSLSLSPNDTLQSLSPLEVAPDPAVPWPSIPGFEILGELGRGGMGIVYKARHLRLMRIIALKLIRRLEDAAPDTQVRFRIEAQMLARVQHPHVVQVYEVGSHAGRPFLVLEYVDGGTLAQRLDGRPWLAHKAAKLVQDLAGGAHAAHLQGIVHRDLKPANVLLAEDGTPKITDFGLARQVNVDVRLTQSGQVLGTPRYMAPEQFKGTDVGPACDVWSLGVLLYELLAGTPPFAEPDLVRLMEQVVAAEPVPPSKRARRQPCDLDSICRKCLEKDPRQRYGSAEELADDLGRFLANEPTRARPPGTVERTWKWARRRPAPAMLLILAVLLATIGFPGVTYLWWEAAEARNHAQSREIDARQARLEAELQKERSLLLSASLQLQRGLEQARSGQPEKGTHWMLEALRIADGLRGEEARALGRVAQANLRSWAVRTCTLRHILSHEDAVLATAISPDGKTVVTGGMGSLLRVWNPVTGALSATVKVPFQVLSLSFTPDGSILFAGGGSYWGSAGVPGFSQRFDGSTFKPLEPPTRHPWHVWSVACSPDGKVLATGSGAGQQSKGQLRLFSAATGKALLPPVDLARPVNAIAFHPRGKTLVAATGSIYQDFKGSLHLHDTATLKPVGQEQSHYSNLYDVCFHPGGKGLVSVGSDTLRYRDANTAAEADACLFTRDINTRVVRYTPDGTFLVLGEENGFVRFRHAPSWQELDCKAFHEGRVQNLAISSDGTWMVTCGESDRTARIWDLPRTRMQPLEVGRPGARGWLGTNVWEEIRGAHFSPDCRSVLLHGNSSLARLLSLAPTPGFPLGPPLEHPHSDISTARFSPNGRLATITTGDRGQLRLHDAHSGEPRSNWLDLRLSIRALAFHPEGQRFAGGGLGGRVRQWDLRGTPLGPLLPQADSVLSLAFSPRGDCLAVGTVAEQSNQAQVRLWSLEGQPIGKPMEHHQDVLFLAFSGDSRTLVTGSRDNTFRVWDAKTGQPRGPARTLTRGWSHAVLGPDGRTLAVGSYDGVVRLWDVANDAPVPGGLLVPARESRAEVVAFDGTGGLLAVGHRDGTAQIWDLVTNRLLGPPVRMRGRLIGAHFSGDGQTLWTVADDGTLRAWPVPRLEDSPGKAELARLALALQVRTFWTLQGDQGATRLSPSQWHQARRERGEVDPLGPPLAREDWHEACFAYADQDGDFHAALWHLKHLITLRPKDGINQLRLGQLSSDQGDLRGAEAAYSRARQLLARTELEAWFRHRAATLHRRNHVVGARWYLEQLTRRDQQPVKRAE